jgi:hypothetical protein
LYVNQVLRSGGEGRTLQAKSFQEPSMSSSNRSRDDLPAGHEPAVPGGVNPPGGADAYATWLDRMQRARARQAAITRNLYTWSNYKSWADQVRDSWQGADSGLKAAGAAPKVSKK